MNLFQICGTYTLQNITDKKYCWCIYLNGSKETWTWTILCLKQDTLLAVLTKNKRRQKVPI